MPAPLAQDPLLRAILIAATEATQSRRGWLFALAGDQLVVTAGTGPGTAARVGARGPRQFGWVGFAISSRQPLAISPRPEDPRFLGDLVADLVCPASLMCFPCSHDHAVVGAIQLEDKQGGMPFTIDDVELVTVLAPVAGAAIAEIGSVGPPLAPSPEDLNADLQRLAATDPERFVVLAHLVDELLAS